VYLNDGDGAFGLKGTVDAGNDPKAIKAADLNGDGNADAVVANDSSGVVTVFIGDGAGGLQEKGTYQAGNRPREIVLPDLDKDGVRDLVVAGGSGSSIIAAFAGEGDGTFSGPDDYTTGPRPNSVDSADFDLDGNADVAAANWSLDNEAQASLSVLFGDGTGTFPAARKIDLVAPGGFRKITVVAAGQLDQVRFIRGDTNGGGTLTITDAILVLKYLFPGGLPSVNLSCLDAADMNDNGKVNVTDAVLILNFLFKQGSPPPAPPYPVPGYDPTPDELGCGT